MAMHGFIGLILQMVKEMTQDNEIPDGVNEHDARKFINEANDRLFKRKEISGKKKKPIVPVERDDTMREYSTFDVIKIALFSIATLISCSMIFFCIGKFIVEIVFGWK